MNTDVVSAVAACGAVIVSVIAVIIAARSAKAAMNSADVASRVLHRSAVRELVVECYKVIEEELLIQSLLIELQTDFNSLYVGNGSFGSSRHRLMQDSLERDCSRAADLAKDARLVVDDQSKLMASADDDLDLMLGRIEAARTELKTIRESMSRQIDNIRAQRQ